LIAATRAVLRVSLAVLLQAVSKAVMPAAVVGK